VRNFLCSQAAPPPNGCVDLTSDGDGQPAAQDGVAAEAMPSIPPEDVVARSGLDAGSVTGFLFENYIPFVPEDGIEVAADITANFSDAQTMIRRQADLGGVPHFPMVRDSTRYHGPLRVLPSPCTCVCIIAVAAVSVTTSQVSTHARQQCVMCRRSVD
jgi:hypothetical protein